ncbi:myosin-J heavy chain-like [Malaya genurostris]|uniref:myosin-J heavy chain-like n=1 Tax=Malaya genurostris TaxID=325434 RepID=UPI0026F3E243|nr:myosin-J heavy chain-like [Malaya genurostris]
MAYTTQRDFFNVTFQNEESKPPVRKRSDGALMTYEFCTDSRAWAFEKEKRSKYILDVVHKARFKEAVVHPEGQFELSKDYLVQMKVDDLADYIVSLQAEIKRKNSTVQELEETRQTLELENNEFRQQIGDLEKVISQLKDNTDCCDRLAKENEFLRCQLLKRDKEVDCKIRLANAKVEADIDQMWAESYQKLKEELDFSKTEFDELCQQNQQLKEQVRKGSIWKVKLSEMKRQFALELAHREKVEVEREHLLIFCEKQFQEIQIKNEYIVETNRRMEKLQYHQHLQQNNSVLAIEELSSTTSLYEAKVLLESCENCKKLEQNISMLEQLQKDLMDSGKLRVQQLVDELQQTRHEKRTLLTSVDVLENELSGYQERIRSADKKVETILKELDSSKRQHDLLRRDYEQFTQTLANQEANETQMLELKSQFDKMNEELYKKSEELNSISAQNVGLKSSLVQCQSRIQTLERKLQAEEDDKVSSAMSELNSVKRLNDELQKKIEVLRSELAAERASSRKLLEDSTLLRSDIARLTGIQTVKERSKSDGEIHVKFLENMTAFKRKARSYSFGAICETNAIRGLALSPEGDVISTEHLQVRQKYTTEIGCENSDASSQLSAVRAENESGFVYSRSPKVSLQSTRTRSKSAGELSEIDMDPPKYIAIQNVREVLRVTGSVEARIRAKSSDAISSTRLTEARNRVKPNGANSVVTEAGCERISFGLLHEYGSKQTRTQMKPSGVDNEAGSTRAQEERMKFYTIVSEAKTDATSVNSHGRIETYQNSPKTSLEFILPVRNCIALESSENFAKPQEAIYTSFADSTTTSTSSSSEAGSDISSDEQLEERTIGVQLKKRTIGITAEKNISRENENSFLNGETILPDISDPGRTRIIAIKIVQHGINILMLSELDYLHREIYRVTLERYRNMTEINEMETMLPVVSSPVPLTSSFLFENEIPTRLPPESSQCPQTDTNTLVKPKLPRVRTASFADDKVSNETRKIFSMIANGSLPSSYPNKRVVDKYRKRPWRA